MTLVLAAELDRAVVTDLVAGLAALLSSIYSSTKFALEGLPKPMVDITPVEDKKVYYVEDTPWRFHGYTYFSDHPEQMIDWFDSHM